MASVIMDRRRFRITPELFDGGDQFHRHIERARAAPLFEGQVPAGLGAAGPFKGREAAFEEGAESSDLAQGRRAGVGVPVRNDRAGVHVEGIRGWRGGEVIGVGWVVADSRGPLGGPCGPVG